MRAPAAARHLAPVVTVDPPKSIVFEDFWYVSMSSTVLGDGNPRTRSDTRLGTS